MRAGHLCVLVILLIISVLSAGCSENTDNAVFDVDGYLERAKDGAYEGDDVTILVPFSNERFRLLQQSMAAFSDETGIEVSVQSSIDVSSQIAAGLDNGTAPDIAAFISLPSARAVSAGEGNIDVARFLSDEYLRAQYGDDLIDLALHEGESIGVWYEVQVDSLVWYPVNAFGAADYDIPETWDDMLLLMEQIIDDGAQPWCIGMAAGPATGWVAADWLEEIVLRNAGPDVYDQWVHHDIPFNSPEIVRSAQILGSVWLEPVNVVGTNADVLTLTHSEAIEPMFLDNPLCYLYQMGWLITDTFPEETVIGEDYDFFYLPPIDPEANPQPVRGTASLFMPFSTGPATFAVMEYLTTADSVRPLIEAGGFIAPHNDVDPDWYPTDIERRLAAIYSDASVFRYDATDLMPAEIGSGVLLTGMTRFIQSGRTSVIEEIFADIEEVWVEDVEGR